MANRHPPTLYLGPQVCDNQGPSALGPIMTLHLELTPLLSLAAGIAILIWPRLLSRIVAIYLIVVGVIGVFGL